MKEGHMTQYITVRNWDKFQHADTTKRGHPPAWIKTYTELLSDEHYLSPTGHERAVLHGLWLEYARTRARLPLDTRSLTRRLALRVTTATLTRLNQAGFLEIRQDTVTSATRLDEIRGDKTKAVLTALPGGGENANSLGNTFENILKEIV